MANKSAGTSDTRTIFTIILLILLPPIGIILMWAWTRWSTVVKVIITLLFTIWAFFFIIMASAVIVTVSPAEQIEKGKAAACVNECTFNEGKTRETCIQQCNAEGLIPATQGNYAQ